MNRMPFASLAALAALTGCMSEASPPPAPVAQRWTPDAIASDQYETTPTFTADGREMYFFKSDPAFSTYRLYWSRCEASGWSPPMPVPFAAPPPAIEADPGITPDGKRLYYISDRHAPGGDDFDIWYVDRIGNGWGPPQRLPAPVNSPASELLPRADASGNLYFGSARDGGHGGGDIYVATQHNGQWQVANAGAPVSTAAFEYEAEISRDGRTMVVVADRGDKSHLYRFEKTGDGWVERGRIPARPDVFQVGPLLSPQAKRLLFAQAHPQRSGEIYVIDLAPKTDEAWPPKCDGPSN
ncbi:MULTISPECIES: PD40 domain-containing protein [Asticcacaulis]|uniref:TolB family protein n=1 Tax=Asticcacaulis TaxID=76890 RepID=UPI001AE2DA2C|nr:MULTISPECIES: PD40 domain-containing protein [Asticcacaulis]MBP2158703.1 Tol biopolymer transport system component [Asticcacaulis solisilvae]MDR6799749.1 Tol biopolymer transport system component [Asticcacaulis sp. BE141]